MFNKHTSYDDSHALSLKTSTNKIKIAVVIVVLLLCSCVAVIGFSSTTTTYAASAKVGVSGNPWGYDFHASGGKVITNPPSTFCHYFHCINTFGNGRGYVVECQDQTFSKSGGIRGSCSSHKGNWRTLYSH